MKKTEFGSDGLRGVMAFHGASDGIQLVDPKNKKMGTK
jgi:hypothetical protein